MSNPNTIDELVRDLTAIHPKPKSDVRQMLLDFFWSYSYLDDLSRAVGLLQGLGRPDRYLEEQLEKVKESIR